MLRIKYQKQGHLLVSHKLFGDGDSKVVRIIIDTEKVNFKLVDPVTGFAHVEGGDGINNLEVLQRHVKKALNKYLGVKLEKEKRQKRTVNG